MTSAAAREVDHDRPRPAAPEAEPGGPGLLERQGELTVLARAVDGLAHARRGAVVTIDGAAGLGRTALLDHAAAAARDAGLRVRSAAAGPLEQGFDHGLLRTLLEPPIRDAAPAEQAALQQRAPVAVALL